MPKIWAWGFLFRWIWSLNQISQSNLWRFTVQIWAKHGAFWWQRCLIWRFLNVKWRFSISNSWTHCIFWGFNQCFEMALKTKLISTHYLVPNLLFFELLVNWFMKFIHYMNAFLKYKHNIFTIPFWLTIDV